MKRNLTTCSILKLLAITNTAVLLSTGASNGALTVAGGIYDSATNANAVDTDATGNLSSFSAAASLAFAAGLGGVANFDDGVENTNAAPLDISYAGGTKSLNITSSVLHNFANPAGTVTPISGSIVFNVTNGEPADVTFTIGPITGASPDEYVTGFGFTILSRETYPDTGRNFTVTAFFSGGGSTSVTSNISNAKADDDTFFGFNAPAGQSITSIFVNAQDDGNSNATEPVFDDFVFITVPEPSSALLIGAGLGLAALRRRRA